MVKPGERFIARQRLGKRSRGNKYQATNKGTVENDIFYSVHAKLF
jgi:hypothetical protein